MTRVPNRDLKAQYRQYSADLLRVTFYIRKLITNPKVETHLKSHHQEILMRFREIIADAPVQASDPSRDVNSPAVDKPGNVEPLAD